MTDANADKFWEFIKDFQVAMVATKDGDQYRARPMAPFIDTENHTLRFLTLKETHKVEELKRDSSALITMCNVVTNSHASISGQVELIDDPQLIARMWGPYAETWFTGTPSSGDVIVLSVKIDKAQYWDGSLNPAKVAKEILLSFAADKKVPDIVDTGKINFA